MNINHDQLEILAREICDDKYGAGHYDKSGTHRNHWRTEAVKLMAWVEAIPVIPAWLVEWAG